MPKKSRLQQLLDAAERHGNESEPDHEVGDLQGVVISCWKVMTEQQKATVFEEHKEDLVDWWLGEDTDG